MNRARFYVLFSLALAGAAAGLLAQQEPAAVPTSYGEASKVDEPVLRVPFLNKPPVIDGVMSPGEWDDASALSGFWYDWGFGNFKFMAPPQTQLQIYMGYDQKNLYILHSSPIYPVDSWLKARGRFPDVLMHPLYGMLSDDHAELEIRPIEDMTRGFKMGLLRWDVNPIGAICDWHWSPTGGSDYKYTSGANIRSVADGSRWIIEYAIPLESLRYGQYDGKEADGRPIVEIPPRDGTIYRAWFARGIGGNGAFFNGFDAHGWNVTKMKLVFDSKAPIFQINELGPLMDGILDTQMTVKNHNTRSETVRLGFHIESGDGPLYSVYESAEAPGGLLELKPGETRTIKLRKQLPSMTTGGNVLWFDVRSAGQPAKTMFLTRLINFHTMDAGGPDGGTFRETRVDAIEKLRPPRNPDFDLRVEVDPYTKRLAAVIDCGIEGVRDEVKTAVEARLIVKQVESGEQTDIHEFSAKMVGNFATFLGEATNIAPGNVYQVTVLLFDENMKIVAEQTETKPFVHLTAASTTDKPITGEKIQMQPWLKEKTKNDRALKILVREPPRGTRRESYQKAPWMENTIGLSDTVWEPFTPIAADDKGFSTLKHRFTVGASGLPTQIDIRPDSRELPLELRGADAKVPAETLLGLGRGPQLRAPMRLEAVIGGKRVPAKVITPAKAVRTWKSEIEYASTLQIGPIQAELRMQYDCDGSMHATLNWGSDAPAKIDRLEMVTEIAGTVDLAISQCISGGGDQVGADRWECSLPNTPGVVWDSTMTRLELFYSRFIPWIWFGSADRGWSYYSKNDEGWILDREGSAMQIERDKAGNVTWRVIFVNHPAEVKEKRTITFTLLTHPAKPKPENARLYAWQYNAGEEWQVSTPQLLQRPIPAWNGDGSKYTLRKDLNDPVYLCGEEELKKAWWTASGAPTSLPYEKSGEWRQDKPPYWRYLFIGEATFMNLKEMNRLYEDKAIFYLERLVRIGRWVGWFMDPYQPAQVSQNVAMGDAWYRPLAAVGTNELPWQAGFTMPFMRNVYKRLARVHAENNVPLRHHVRANNSARMLESFLWNTLMLQDCGATFRSYDIDLITAYPNSLYRAMSMNYSGLTATMVPAEAPTGSGDNPRFDRQMLGLGLLHDFGVTRGGELIAGASLGLVHMEHQEQAVRLLGALARFGFFKDAGIEKVPFWRNDAQVRMGDKPGDESRVRVTVYRRPMDTGKGYKAIFVILNESDADVELPLDIRDPKRILGGPNTQKGRDSMSRVAMPAKLDAAWKAVIDQAADLPVLTDLETGELIGRSGTQGERYGPVHVPYHDYRILYGECAK
ncbi:MAG: hypothetical protein FJ222_02710 [Lentisphaerae bacterium]|nr:hypothetical protein [Lentisphaerota bacterium]